MAVNRIDLGPCAICNGTEVYWHGQIDGYDVAQCYCKNPTEAPTKPQGIVAAEKRRDDAANQLRGITDVMTRDLLGISTLVSRLNSLWEHDLDGNPIEPDFPEMLMLVVCECAEAMEGFRTGKMDKKHPTRKNFDIEIGDAIIRLFHIAARSRIDIGAVIVEILLHNVVRPDHQWEERIKRHGKKI